MKAIYALFILGLIVVRPAAGADASLESALSFVSQAIFAVDLPSRCTLRSFRNEKWPSTLVAVIDLKAIDPSKVRAVVPATSWEYPKIYIETTNLKSEIKTYYIERELGEGGRPIYYRNAKPVSEAKYENRLELSVEKGTEGRVEKALKFAVAQCGGKEGW